MSSRFPFRERWSLVVTKTGSYCKPVNDGGRSGQHFLSKRKAKNSTWDFSVVWTGSGQSLGYAAACCSSDLETLRW